MAFAQKTWKDRVAEYINRRILTKEDGTKELVSVERNEGTISQEGDAFSAENMNDLEQRIANEFSEQSKKLSSGEVTFNLDYRNDKWGWNEDPARGADTFHPFNNIADTTAVASQVTEGYVFYDADGNRCVGTRPVAVTKQSGSVTFMVGAATSSGSKTTDYLVAFPSAFDKVPAVTAAPTSQGEHFTVSTFNVTQTSFYIRVVNHSLYGSQDITFNWVAQAE